MKRTDQLHAISELSLMGEILAIFLWGATFGASCAAFLWLIF